MGENDLDDCL